MNARTGNGVFPPKDEVGVERRETEHHVANGTEEQDDRRRRVRTTWA